MNEKNVNINDPITIRRHASAAMDAFAMLAGMQLDVFTPLKDGPMSADTIAKSLGVQDIYLTPLLYSLVMADLLRNEDGFFSNTDEANRFLVKSSPEYVGDWVSDFYDRRWNVVLQTAKTIRSGNPQAKLDWQTLEEDRVFEILNGLHPGAIVAGKQLAKRYNFNRFKHLLDAGGGTGGLTIGLCESCSNLRGTVVDLPGIVSISKKFITEAHMSDRISAIDADLIDRPPKGMYDAAILRGFIQTLAPNEAISVLKNIGKAMEPGGIIYILGYVIDDTRLWPKTSVDWNLYFLNIYDNGRAFSESEHRDWLVGAGFTDVSVEYEVMPSNISVVTARKI